MLVKQLVLVACSFALSGCGLISNTVHNFINEPIQCLNDTSLTKATRAWGKSALGEYIASHPECVNSKSFAEGFVDGYSDYLDNGGSGSSPAVPPLPYRRNRFLTPEGHQAMADYASGFAAGTSAAQISGIRNSLTVPVQAPANSASDFAPEPAGPSNVLPPPNLSKAAGPKVKIITVVEPQPDVAPSDASRVKPITVWTGVPSH